MSAGSVSGRGDPARSPKIMVVASQGRGGAIPTHNPWGRPLNAQLVLFFRAEGCPLQQRLLRAMGGTMKGVNKFTSRKQEASAFSYRVWGAPK